MVTDRAAIEIHESKDADILAKPNVRRDPLIKG
jgi:hypothetical protein